MNAKRGYIRGSDVTMRTMYSTRTRFQSPSPSFIYGLTLLASFFLPSHLSFKNMYILAIQIRDVHVHCTYMTLQSRVFKILLSDECGSGDVGSLQLSEHLPCRPQRNGTICMQCAYNARYMYM